jgi:hypothetical protein
MERVTLGCGTTLVMLFLAACGSGSPTAPTATPAPTPVPAMDAVSVGSLAPAAGTPLQASQTVMFTATLNYTLGSAESGQVVIVIQDQSGRSLQPPGRPQPAAVIAKGTGTATLADSIVVPASGVSSVRVFFPLIPSGASRTDVVVSVNYPVS